MRSGGLILMTVATLLICCCAYSRQEQDAGEEHPRDSYDGNGHRARSINPLGDGHLVREVREAHRIAYPQARRNEFASLYGAKRFGWPFMSPMEFGYYGEGLPKRNFDEIDRSNLDSFVKKRNFDEIDQTSMPFPSKRFAYKYGYNDIEMPVVSNFDKRPDYPMDEIDLSGFPIGSKRSGHFVYTHPLR